MTTTRIAEATGRAGGTGPELSNIILNAQIKAQQEINDLGIADDASYERLVEVIGEAPLRAMFSAERLEELHGGDLTKLTGADVIREAKIGARLAAKRAYNAEQAAKATEAE